MKKKIKTVVFYHCWAKKAAAQVGVITVFTNFKCETADLIIIPNRYKERDASVLRGKQCR